MKILWAVLGAAALASGYSAEAPETIRRTFPAAARLEVDNVWGSIHVTGYDGDRIEMTAVKTIHAESPELAEAARREVKLDITEEGGLLKLYVDGPFRCNHGEGCRDGNHREYHVNYDFELKAPVGTVVRLSTVNHGDIDVSNTAGDFDVRNVNGGVSLREMGGSGRAHTVNGKVTILFARNPARECSFKTVNGDIDAAFRPNLAANVQVKTFNGEAYTDFESQPLLSPAAAERRNGKFIYRSSRFSSFRIGAGGPELKLDTLNGTVRISNRGK